MFKQTHTKTRGSKLKRLLAMSLAALTIFTSIPLSSAPIHANAEETKVGDSADNKGAGDGGLDSSLSGNLSWYSKRQGYRIYIINSNHERISPVYDFVNSNPALDVPLENMCKTTRFDSAISPDDSFYQLNDFKTLKDWCKATTNPPLAVLNLGGGNYKGNGTAFKDWFFAGAEGTIHLDNGGSSKDNQVQKTTPKPTSKPTSSQPLGPFDAGYKAKCSTCGDKGAMFDGTKYVKCPDCTITRCPKCNNRLSTDNRGICSNCEITWFSYRCGWCGYLINAQGICDTCKSNSCKTCGKRYDATGRCPSCDDPLVLENCYYCDNFLGYDENKICNECIVKLCKTCGKLKRSQWDYCPSCDYTNCFECNRSIVKGGECGYCANLSRYPRCKICDRTLDNYGLCANCSLKCSICGALLTGELLTCYKHGMEGDMVGVMAYPDNYWAKDSELSEDVKSCIGYGKRLHKPDSVVVEQIYKTYESTIYSNVESRFKVVQSMVANIHPDDALNFAVGSLYSDYMNKVNIPATQLAVMVLEQKEKFMESDTYKQSFYGTVVIPGIPSKDAFDNPFVSSGNIKLASTSSLLFTQIPLAGSEPEKVYTTNGKSPAYNLVNQTEHIKVEGYEYPSQAMEDGAYLVVEPITWLNRRTGTGAWDDPSQYTPYPVYGSYWNLVQGWVGNGGFYSTNMKELFNHCLITSKEVTSTGTDGKLHTIKAVTDTSAKSVSKSAQMMRDGYGLSMHIYDADASTSTYDEDLGEEIGPSPDDSSKLSGDDKKNPDKYATIIKFYEDMTLKEDDEDKYHAFVRTPVPKAIKFEDESELTGYAIAEWFTTDTHFESVDDEARYESYKESNEILRDSEHWGNYLNKNITLGDKGATENAEEQSLIDREKCLVLLYQNTGGTSTYDESQSTNPAPSPDDSNLLTEDQKSDPDKHVQIIKFYENHIYDGSVLKDIERVNHTRDKAPSLINIEDEPEYEVKDWFTTHIYDEENNVDSHKITLSQDDTYESIKSSYTVVNTGDAAGEITLQVGTDSEACVENTLFVYLYKETKEPTPPPDLSGDLTQSKLTVKATSESLAFTTKLSNHTFKLTTNTLDSSHTYYHGEGNYCSCSGHYGTHTDSCYEKDEEGKDKLVCTSSHYYTCVSKCYCPGHPHTLSLADTALSINIKNDNNGSGTYIRAQLPSSPNFTGVFVV